MPRFRANSISPSHPLLALLVGSALIEILVHRILVTLLAPPPLGEVTRIYRILADLAPFFSYLAGLATLPIIVSSAYRVLVFDEEPPTWVKLILGLAACLFLPLGAVSMAANMQPAPGIPPNAAAPLLPYLNLVFMLYLGALLLLAWTSGSSPRRSVAMTLIVLPLLGLALYRNMLWDSVSTDVGQTERARTATFLVEHGRLVVELAGLWLFFLLAPSRHSKKAPGRKRGQDHDVTKWLSVRTKAVIALITDPGALAVGLAITVSLSLAAKFRYRTAEHLATHALGISVPTTTAKALAVILSSVAFFTLLVGLVRSEEKDRASAAGLLLIALSGFRLDNPLYYMLAAAGLQILALPAPPTASRVTSHVTARQWKTWLASIRAVLSTLGLEGGRIGAADTPAGSAASLFGSFEETNLEIRFESTKEGRLTAEVLIGELPASKPDLVLLVKRSSTSMTPPRVRVLTISDPDGLAQRLLDAGAPLQRAGLRPGRIAVWWGIGLRYQVNLAGAQEPLSLPFDRLVNETVSLARKASILPEAEQQIVSAED